MLDDAWNAAMSVRTWLATAQGSLGSSYAPKKWIFRRSHAAHVDEAVDAIGQMRLAYLDLEHALHRAEMDGPALTTLQLEMFRSVDFGIGRIRLSDDAIDHLRVAVTEDLAKIDALVSAVEVMQRASRSASS